VGNNLFSLPRYLTLLYYSSSHYPTVQGYFPALQQGLKVLLHLYFEKRLGAAYQHIKIHYLIVWSFLKVEPPISLTGPWKRTARKCQLEREHGQPRALLVSDAACDVLVEMNEMGEL
jgi:hypothetical protein